MTEEEFDNYYQNGFKGGHRVNNNNENKWNGKTRFYESYTYQNGRWKETTLEQLKKDIGDDLPEIKKDDKNFFWWVSKQGRDYYINSFPLVGLLYDHVNRMFIYPTTKGLIPGTNVFNNEESVRKWIYDEEESHRGEIGQILTKEQVEAQEQARKMGQGFREFSDGNGHHQSFTFRFG